MPEQAEFVSDSGDYTWRPEYVRRAVENLKPKYDTRTLGERIADLEKRIAQLEAERTTERGTL